MRYAFLTLALILADCTTSVENSGFDATSTVQLKKMPNKSIDTSGVPSSISMQVYIDSNYTGDSALIKISDEKDTIQFTFDSFMEKSDFRNFDVIGYSIFEKGSVTYIYLNVLYHLSDVILPLEQEKQYSFNVISNFQTPLPKGKYIFLVNVGTIWFKGNETSHLIGKFMIE